MKHTYTHIQRVVSVASAFVLTFTLGVTAGNAIVDDAYSEGTGLSAMLVRPTVTASSSQSSRTLRPKKKKVRRLHRAAIVKPSTRSIGSGSSVSRAAVSSATTAPIKASCGDKLVIGDLGETCDDGNKISGDGCSSVCVIESGFQCFGQPSICTARCGDGNKTALEKCDDGNILGGDGCSAVCKIEFQFVCTGSPSVCERTPYCGDGNKASAEECDDGNADYGDGCTPACETE